MYIVVANLETKKAFVTTKRFYNEFLMWDGINYLIVSYEWDKSEALEIAKNLRFEEKTN